PDRWGPGLPVRHRSPDRPGPRRHRATAAAGADRRALAGGPGGRPSAVLAAAAQGADRHLDGGVLTSSGQGGEPPERGGDGAGGPGARWDRGRPPPRQHRGRLGAQRSAAQRGGRRLGPVLAGGLGDAPDAAGAHGPRAARGRCAGDCVGGALVAGSDPAVAVGRALGTADEEVVMAHLSGLVDPIAQRLLELQKVSSSQWVLRALGVLAMGAAVALTLPGGPFSGPGSTLLTLLVATGTLIQTVWPDSDVGLIAPLALILVLAGQLDLTVLR